MTTPTLPSANTTIDPALVSEIVRRVLTRMRAGKPIENTTPDPLRLVTVDTVVAHATSNDRSIRVNGKSVITPAARDEAKRRGIKFVTDGTAHHRLPIGVATMINIIDTTEPAWTQSVVAGLARRGIDASTNESGTVLVITDTPAKLTHQYSVTGNHRAAMLTTISDVDRFWRELRPNVWVVDKTRVNLPTIVNIAARITSMTEAQP